MISLGLCCIFKDQPIRFRRTTAKHLLSLPENKQKEKLADICLSNAGALMDALVWCRDHGIGCFRINSQILPLKTHPQAGYDVRDLPRGEKIIDQFKDCGTFSRHQGVRTTFHPDQFIVLSSPDAGVVSRSIADLVYQAQVAEWVNADVINIHGGGVYGNKTKALQRLKREIAALPRLVRSRLTLENDDRSYTPEDLLPVCREMEIPLVYDVHHHRCLPDSLDTASATQCAIRTWNRRPLFHISSPLEGWQAGDVRKHHDYIHVSDFPDCWQDLDITVEVEAKAKERAVLQLMSDLRLQKPPGGS